MSAGRGAPRFVVGIDLGTTNSAVAFAELAGERRIGLFRIPQLVAEGEVQERDALPSAVYLAGEVDVPAGALALPWREDRRYAVGALARRLGERIAGRLVTSAKSWLCHAGVERTAPILPWGAPAEVDKLSPIAASARILEHVRDAWGAAHPDAPLAEQDVVLTVPASFDEVARELTVEAASRAGLPRLRLLEEPQAAIYAWIAEHADWRERLADHRLVLVVDVGGGTTDFSAIAVRRLASGLTLERVAVGDHLLLGGDNMDMALARGALARQAEAVQLDAARWQQLVALCREAKERLLAPDAPDSTAIALPGRGRGVVSGALRLSLGAAETIERVLDGFFPAVAREARPRGDGSAGLAEFGLPFASDPEITRHLAAFLQASAPAVREALADAEAAAGPPGADGEAALPDVVLFNGGALKPARVRARVLDVLERWGGRRPLELAGADLDLAVARGAVAYGLAVRGSGVRIGGGAPRAYYVGLARDPVAGSPGEAAPLRALCIAPRGMEEGAEVEIAAPEFEVVANAPVVFPIFASVTRTGDRGGAVVDLDPASVAELPPIATVLRFGRALAERRIPVHLRSVLTETGTLELWCHARQTDHRWRLNFDLRSREAKPAAAPAGGAAEGGAPAQEAVLAAARVEAAARAIDACFGETSGGDPVGLVRALEAELGLGKDAWPLAVIRRLWDGLFELQARRGRTAAHEARWLNLAGFLLRPGYGESRDPWRVERLWRLFDQGPGSPGAAQVRAEWWTLWKRVAGGLSRPQQQAVLQEIRPLLLPDVKKKAKPGRWKGSPQELREMWQVAGALERLPAGSKLELARALAPRVLKGKAGEAETWALGRLLARAPIHGPANAVVEPHSIELWLEELAAGDRPLGAAVALAVAQMARLTGDRARDVDPGLRARLAERLASEPEGARLARWLREEISLDVRDQALVLADALPIGLRLAGARAAEDASAIATPTR